MDDIKVPTAKVAVRFLNAWTEYKPDAEGVMREEDWIEYCAPGMAHISTTQDAVRRVQRDKGKWASLEPYYNAWKQNSEIPTDGTPLAAWPGVTKQQAEVLKGQGIRTVEDVAGMNDSMIGRIALPNVRALKEQAQRYLDARDNHRVEAALKEKDDQIATLKAQMDQLAELVAAKMDAAEENEPAKRGPGRPRKNPEAVAAE
jgi:hypothetical protein